MPYLENPEPAEPFERLCYACRVGDVSEVQKILTEGEADINGIDDFDNSPLILASLCGHFEICYLLLESGAISDGPSGERCLYNALNDRIRDLLMRYDYSKNSDPHTGFSKHISSLYTKPLAKKCRTCDFTFTVFGARDERIEFHVHRFLLASRCPRLANKLMSLGSGQDPQSDPGTEVIDFVLRYAYLFDVPESLVSAPALSVELRRALNEFQLLELLRHVENPVQGTDRRSRKRELVDRAQADLSEFLQTEILGRVCANQPLDYRPRFGGQAFEDVILSAESEDGKTASFYPAHRAMLRCEYFDTMFNSGFKESYWESPSQLKDTEKLPIIHVMIAPQILEIILQWFYTDTCDIPIRLALDLLYGADMLLIEPLKLKAGTVLTAIGWSGGWSDHLLYGSELGFSIFEVVRAGWELRVRRLEEFGAKFLAERLEDVLPRGTKLCAEFEDLVKESASRVKEREDIDTIEIIDDMQFYLSERFRMRQEDLQAGGMFSDQAADETNTKEDCDIVEEAAANGDLGLGTSTTKYDQLSQGLDELLGMNL